MSNGQAATGLCPPLTSRPLLWRIGALWSLRRLGWRLARCPVCESLFCADTDGGCDGIPY